MAGLVPQRLAQLEALGLPQIVAVAVRRHLVGLVHDHQVPVGGLELGHQVLAPGELVDSGDEQVLVLERVAGQGGLDRGPRHHLEAEAKAVPHLVLPLLRQAAGCHHQAAGYITPQHQLPDEQTRHDGLARAGVVGQHELEGFAGQ